MTDESLEVLRSTLRNGIRYLTQTLLGQPNFSSNKRELRWGRKGSIRVIVDGAKQGACCDFESGWKGDPLGLIQHIRGCDFPEAIRWATAWAGLEGVAPDLEVLEQAQVQRAGADREAAADHAKRIKAAQFMAGRAIAVPEDGVGQKYLIETRKIPFRSSGWPTSVRFLPAWGDMPPAVVFVATNDAGTICGVQKVEVTAEAEKIRKVSRGVFAETGAVVRLEGVEDGPLLITEGPEDGLSVWSATGLDTWIAAGSMGRLNNLPRDRPVVVCRNDDPENSPAEVALEQAIARWRAAGVLVVDVLPWTTRRHDKSDWNDLIKEGGPSAIRDRITAAIYARVGVAPADPPRALPTGTLQAARDYLDQAGREFFRLVPEGTLPRQTLLRSQGGTGKTEMAGRLMPEAVVIRKKQGLPHRYVSMVPEHKNLGAQTTERYAAFGLNAFHLRGRGDPFRPKPDDLCQDPESVQQALIAGQSVKETCCGVECPVRKANAGYCAYLDAVAVAAQADVVTVAHSYLTHRLPKPVKENLAGVVIDEDFQGGMDWIFDLTADMLDAQALVQWPVLKDGEPDRDGTRALGWTHTKIGAALDLILNGMPPDEAVKKSGLYREEIVTGRKLDWRRQRDAQMYSGMPIEDRREVARAASINGKLPRIAALYDVMEEILRVGAEANGRLAVDLVMTKDGASKQVTIRTQKNLAAWTEDLPVLMLNSTAQIDDVRRVLPRTVERKGPEVATPHNQTVQILGGFSKSSMAGSPKKMADVKAWMAVMFPDQSLGFIGHKASVEAFAALPNSRVTWHGANAGDDSFKDRDVTAVFDGPRARPDVIAALASARTGRQVVAAAPVMSQEVALMSDGRGVSIPVLRYKDPDAQAVHESIHQSAIRQAAARPRQVLRTALTPSTTLIFGNVTIDKPVDVIVQWRDAKPDRMVHMAAAGRVCSNALDMHRWHPTHFRSEKAASTARRLFGDVTQRLNAIWQRDPRPWSEVRFKPAGQGQHVHSIFCPSAQVPALQDEVTEHHGVVIYWDEQVVSTGQREVIPKRDLRHLSQMGMTSSVVPVVSARPAPIASVQTKLPTLRVIDADVEQAEPPEPPAIHPIPTRGLSSWHTADQAKIEGGNSR